MIWFKYLNRNFSWSDLLDINIHRCSRQKTNCWISGGWFNGIWFEWIDFAYLIAVLACVTLWMRRNYYNTPEKPKSGTLSPPQLVKHFKFKIQDTDFTAQFNVDRTVSLHKNHIFHQIYKKKKKRLYTSWCYQLFCVFHINAEYYCSDLFYFHVFFFKPKWVLTLQQRYEC